MSEAVQLRDLLAEIRACQRCSDLPLGPNPVLRVKASARLLIVGQAPGTRVHHSGIPWNDPSGDRLRDWMGVNRDIFYDESRIAIVPMGLCYPGRGKSGDLPPRPECAPTWHPPLLTHLTQLRLILLVGQYAQRYYLREHFSTVTTTVSCWQNMPGAFFPLVHPSPRNRLWLKKNPWFEEKVVPDLRRRIQRLI